MTWVKFKKDTKYWLSFPLTKLAILAVIVGGIWLLYRFVYDKPSTVFNAMLSNSLSTTGYIKSQSLSSNGESINQKVLLQFGGKNKVQEIETYQLAGGQGLIITNNIGTPYTDYASYNLISTNLKNSSGHIINYSSAVGTWGTSSPGGTKATDGELFNSAVFGIVPVGNVTQAQRQQLMSFIKKNKVYTVSNNVGHSKINGRSQIVFNVEINSTNLTQLMVTFGLDLGFNQFNQSAANNIPTTSGVTYKFYVDSLTRQLTEVTAPNDAYNISFSAYGIKQEIPLPKKTIPLATLEGLIQSLSNK